MNITILRERQIGEPSVSKLMRKMNEMGISSVKTDGYSSEFNDTDILIRWGMYSEFPLKSGAIELNTRESIALGSNKRKTRMALQLAGVSVPKTWDSKSKVLNDPELVFPLIGRPTHHTQGQNVEFIENRQQLRNSNSSYWSEFIPKEKEFRVYVFGGKILGVVEKIPQNTSAIAWNSCLGATFNDITGFPESLVVEAIKGANAVGQYFSGVDLMWSNGKPYILELNSSLALSNPHRVEIFAKAFEWVVDYYKEWNTLAEYPNSRGYYHPSVL